MANSQLFVRDMKQWLAPLSFAPDRPAGADTLSPETLAALRSILIEIEQASVYTAITTSIVGALADGRSNRLTAHHLADYVPPSPEMYRKEINGILSASLPASVLLPVQGYHARLSSALRMTRAIVDAGPAPSTAVRGLEFEKLEDAWRHVCGTALAAIAVLRETLASVRYSRPPVNNEHAEALLRSAKSGGRPCVSAEGDVQMPRWAESRAHTRLVTRQAARIIMPGGTQHVLVENVSRTGLGLSGIKNAVTGARLAIEVLGTERLAGRIMWARAERAGVKLDVILMPDHPLLIGQVEGSAEGG